MEIITFDNDIKVICIQAQTFPDGVLDAHQKLHVLIPFSQERKYFGISRPEGKAGIVYKAAAEEKYQGEAEKLKCDTLVLKKGKYISVTIVDFMNDVSTIGKTFNELITRKDIDPEGYCVEWYFNEKDVRCMIRLQ